MLEGDQRPVVVDLFCGAGGFSLGFEQAGFRIGAAVDSDPIHARTFKINHPNTPTITADLRELTGAELRRRAKLNDTDVSVVIGGPPCQGFSMIGRRDAADPRNDLLNEFTRLVSELQPRFFVMENVPGLLIGDHRALFDRWVERIRRSAYDIVDPPQVLDAQNFGVPQRRKRLIVLGHRQGVAAPIYPGGGEDTARTAQSDPSTVWDAIGDLPEVEKATALLRADSTLVKLGEPSEYAAQLRDRSGVWADGPASVWTDGRVITASRRTVHSRKSRARFAKTKPGSSEPVSRYHRLHPDRVAPTLRAGTGPSGGSFTAARPIHPMKPRCITVREAARLQSFPDWYVFHPTIWHGFRQVGNAVPPFLAQRIAAMLREQVRPT